MLRASEFGLDGHICSSETRLARGNTLVQICHADRASCVVCRIPISVQVEGPGLFSLCTAKAWFGVTHALYSVVAQLCQWWEREQVRTSKRHVQGVAVAVNYMSYVLQGRSLDSLPTKPED